MDKEELNKRMDEAIRLTAPGQPIRAALDMIIAGHLGALSGHHIYQTLLLKLPDGFPYGGTAHTHLFRNAGET